MHGDRDGIVEQIFGPVFVPGRQVPMESWEPVLPTNPPARVDILIAAIPAFFMALGGVVPAEQLTNQPVYPDVLPQWEQQPHASRMPSVFYVGNPADEDPVAEEMGWQPVLPDFARSVDVHASQMPFVFWDPQRALEEDFGWRPIYPDFARSVQPHASQFPSTFFEGEPSDVPPQAEELGWLPVYPDQIDRVETHASRAPAVFFAPQDFAPAFDPADNLSWLPDYPDQVPGKPPQPYRVSGGALLAEQTVDTLDWRPVYPDQIARVETHPSTHAPAVFFQGEPSDVVVPFDPADVPSWLPVYPDLHPPIQRRPYRTESGALSAPDRIDEFAWRPIYPDFVHPLDPGTHASAQPFLSWNPLDEVPPDAFDGIEIGRAVYPDVLPHWTAQSHASQMPSTFFVGDPRDLDLSAEEMGWQPVYPDAVDRLETHPSGMPSIFYEPEPITASDDLGWRPSYPDTAPGVSTHPSQMPSVFYTPEPFTVDPTVQFLPVYPDAVARLEAHPSQMPSVFEPGLWPPTQDVPGSWTPVYPDRIDPLARGVHASQAPFFFFDPDPIPTPEIPLDEMAWRPAYPDLIDPTPGTHASQQRAFFAPDQVPELEAFHGLYPEYPDFARGRGIHAAQMPSVFWPEQEPPVDIDRQQWRPTYPDLIDRRAPHASEMPSVFFEPVPIIPSVADWGPISPDQIDRVTLPVAAMPSVFEELDPSDFPVPADSWYPTYPDLVPGEAIHASQHPAVFMDPEPLPDVAVPDFIQGVYPDQIARATVHASEVPFFFFDPTPFPTFDPAVSPQVFYPDWIAPSPPAPHASSFPVFFFPEVPIPPGPRPLKPPILEHDCPPTGEHGARAPDFTDA